MDIYSTPSTIGSTVWRPEDIFADLRRFNRPSTASSWSGSSGVGVVKATSDGTSTPGSTGDAAIPNRFVRMPKVTPDGGALSYSKEHRKTVIVGRETLRLIGLSDSVSNTEDGGANESIPPAKRMTYLTGEDGSKVEIGINYWTTNLRSTRQMTDITWGPEMYKNKVFTSSSNGEILGWDLGDGSLKLETTLIGGSRSVNVVTAATYSGYNIVSGSTDGSVKLWDLRAPKTPTFNLSGHGAPVRSLTFGKTSSFPVHVVLGQESGMITRYDLRMRVEYLDRIFAHTACVHDLAWLPPSKDDTCAGYLASGSLDHTVKIWQIEATRILPKPLHTIHTPYPVGKIAWRPDLPTEIIVLPYHSSASHLAGGKSAQKSASTFKQGNVGDGAIDRYAPQIWDVRKGWVAKWAVDAADGPATDLGVVDSDVIHLLYKSGSFIQHDLRAVSRPSDHMPRQALSWNARSSLFFVADVPRPFDPPYDDLHPEVASHLNEMGMMDKHPGDRLGIQTTQVIGRQIIPFEFDHDVFYKLAREYNHHHEDKVQMCKINEQAARAAGDDDIAQTWALLGSLLTDFIKLKEVELNHNKDKGGVPITPGFATDKSTAPPSAREPLSAAPSISKSPILQAQIKKDDVPTLSHPRPEGANTSEVPKRKGSGGAAMLPSQVQPHNPGRRGSSPSLLSALRPSLRSSSNSPRTRPIKLPGSVLHQSNFVGAMSYTPESSLHKPMMQRRMSISSSSRSPDPGANGQAGESVTKAKPNNDYSGVGQGALEGKDSDSDEEVEPATAGTESEAVNQSENSANSAWSKERRKLSTMGRMSGIQHPTLHSSSSSNRSSPAIGAKDGLPPVHLLGSMSALASHSSLKLSSPQSQLLNIQDVNEEDQEASDEYEEGDEASRSSDSLVRRSEDEGMDIPHQAGTDPHTKLSPPSPTLAKYIAKSSDSSRTATIGRSGLRVLTKQDSASSLTTAYQSGSMGFTGSYGSNVMTPTVSRIAIQPSIRQEIESPPTRKDNDPSTGGGGTKKVTVGGSSPGRKQLKLRDIFSPNSAAPSSSAPTTTTSTNPPGSALRSAIPRNSSFGSRFNKGINSSLTSSIPPPGLGTAGLDRESFMMPGDNEDSKSAFREGSIWEQDTGRDAIIALEREHRNTMWEVAKEMLEAYAEAGDVQTCAAMAMAAQKELGISDERLERIVSAYLDQLMKMRLHLNAAYVRQASPVTSLKESTTMDITQHVNCGRCGKLLEASAPPDVDGRFAYCGKCRMYATRCAICHLPVRKIFFLCHGCGHGGHQKCYYEFYVKHPPVDLSTPQGKFPYRRSPDDEDFDHPAHKLHRNLLLHPNLQRVNADGSIKPRERSMSLDEPGAQDEKRWLNAGMGMGISSGPGSTTGSVDGASPTPRGRRRDIRRGASDMDTPETIPEKEAANFTSTPPTSTSAPSASTVAKAEGPPSRGGAGSIRDEKHHGSHLHHHHPHTRESSSQNKRSVSAAESTVMDEDRGIPDEEYIQAREKEQEGRERAKNELALVGHPCAAGCGHFCWMARA
ncbi:hypothetical protein CPB86DRAFT_592041 [Serendipita vermifera]|nr:hypothetical protein CPB86DRAFT_592041 [Serendipita vermifera]